MHSRTTIVSHRRWWDFIVPLLDAAALMTSLAAVGCLARGGISEATVAVGFVTIVVFLLSAQLTGLYRRDDTGSADREVAAVVATWTVTVLTLALLALATRYGKEIARQLMFAWIIVAPSLVGLTRMCLRIVHQGLLRRGVGVRTVAIAGFNDLGRQTAANIRHDSSLGFRLVGFYDDRSPDRSPDTAADRPRIGDPDEDGRDGAADECENAAAASRRDGPRESRATSGSWEPSDARRGDLPALVAAARRGDIDTVLVTLPMRGEDRIRFLLDELSDSTVSVYIVPDFFVFELLHSRWTSLNGLPAVSVFENPLYGVDGIAKRISDVALAIAGLGVAAIPMIAIALAVKFTSRGPVFFRQRRYGLDGQEIRVWKFRSMRVCDDGPEIRQATRGDPRVTPVGGLLRRTSLDELPQLFNVLEGSMSLVGPRPHATAHNEQYRQLIRGYMLRHKVKPGITGLAQVNGCRGETESVEKMRERVDWDHRYIRGWSLWLDFRILIKTLRVVLSQQQAY